MTWLLRLYDATSWLGERKRGEKNLKKGALHLNDGLVHRSAEDLSVQSGKRLHQAGQQ